ncbi:unnamed protein product [Clonostachys rosea]|uniref:Zn(2)-C6 fungal-type domain-containing protein n=1 Tax=Bionectria ochroleuca TaxID=29856 RepID=A0ABY6TU08_BIOOC|nr:unnamed protein product [Clonostachys rosea]
MSASSSQSSSKARGPARSVKKRTGCEQCKKRRVKCDEQQPSCSRCVARGETCTGNFRFTTWQIERPWASQNKTPSIPGPALEDETLRHWYDKACLVMALVPPPANPLSYPLARLLQHSRALRHTLQSISGAHRAGFSVDSRLQALKERNLAIVSLQGEVGRVLSPISASNREVLLKTLILSSLILCLSSSWLDPSGNDSSLEFLCGTRDIIPLLAELKSSDAFTFYILGFYLYMECFSSCLIPISKQKLPHPSILEVLTQHPFDRMIHPVNGLSTTLYPILIEIGYYYRQQVEGSQHSPEQEMYLRQRLMDWKLPEHSFTSPHLTMLVEGYRSIGHIMLYQAQRVTTPLDSIDEKLLLQDVTGIMNITKTLPPNDTNLNWLAPLLVIVGGEIPPSQAEERAIIVTASEALASFTGVPNFKGNLECIEQVWRARDNGEETSWLQVMLKGELVLALA